MRNSGCECVGLCSAAGCARTSYACKARDGSASFANCYCHQLSSVYYYNCLNPLYKAVVFSVISIRLLSVSAATGLVAQIFLLVRHLTRTESICQ
jgi:hypothetical protein